MTERKSLRWLLVSRLLLFLLPLAGLTLAGAYVVTMHYANVAFDRALARRVYALADQVEVVQGRPVVDLPRSTHEILEFDPADVLYFRVIGPAGEHLGGERELPLDAQHTPFPMGKVWFYDARVEGEAVRVAAYVLSLKGTQAQGAVTILSGETTAKRTHLADEVLLTSLVSMLIIIGVMVYVINLGVDISLRPIRQLRQAMADRAAHDLEPIALSGLPEEIEPLLVETNKLMRDLRALLDSRQQFLADAAHQLRTPLAALRARVELAMEDESNAANKKMFSDMLASLDRQGRLVQQLLALSRAEARDEDCRLEELDVDELARKRLAEWAPLAVQRGIDLAFEGSDGRARILGNAYLLDEALSNLLDNALRYCRAGDSVVIRTLRENQQVCLVVSDTGPGVPAQSLPRLFQRFYRVPGAPGAGCGLGLAIVAQVARLHGGTAEALITAGGGLEIRMCFRATPSSSNPGEKRTAP